ncbi:MAG: hypothetical protein CMK07_08115 [Ponticaulis sp.]|nr:hypothetical protein [Ponticaulis sp.]
MSTPDFNEDDYTPERLKDRVGTYLTRALKITSGWGLQGRGQHKSGFFNHLCRFDANRLDRLVRMAEHLVRCLIIWMAYRACRDGEITPHPHHLPVQPDHEIKRTPQEPVDFTFRLRGIPVYEPKLPPFCISMPSNEQPLAAMSRDRSKPLIRRRRKRNDDVLDCSLLIERALRIETLVGEIDARAIRLAQHWKGRVMAATPDPQLSLPFDDIDQQPDDTDKNVSECVKLLPLKTADPPPDLLEGAAEDETNDLHALHDVALRTADMFPALCG